MNQEVKTKWLEALRGGKYSQGRRVLRTPANEYCCLGVLCDIYAQESSEVRWIPIQQGWRLERDKEPTAESTYLPKYVSEWAGIEGFNPRIDGFTENGLYVSTLASANDVGMSFNEIADIIEKEL